MPIIRMNLSMESKLAVFGDLWMGIGTTKQVLPETLVSVRPTPVVSFPYYFADFWESLQHSALPKAQAAVCISATSAWLAKHMHQCICGPARAFAPKVLECLG